MNRKVVHNFNGFILENKLTGVEWEGLEQDLAFAGLDAVPSNAREWKKFKLETEWWTQTRKKMGENKRFFIKGLLNAPFDFKKSPRELMNDATEKIINVMTRNGYTFDDLVWVRDESVKRFFVAMVIGCATEETDDCVYYRNANESLFLHEKKNEKFWVSYGNVWSFFETYFNLNYVQIKKLIEYTLAERLNLGHLTVDKGSGGGI